MTAAAFGANAPASPKADDKLHYSPSRELRADATLTARGAA